MTNYTPARVPYAWMPTTSFVDVDRELQRIQRQQAGMFQPQTITHARSPYTVQMTDTHLLADATNGTVTFVFPDAARLDGAEVRVTRVDATTNAITLSGTFGGVVNPILRLQYESTCVSAGRGTWYVVGPNETQTWTVRGSPNGGVAIAGDFYSHVMLGVCYDASGGSNNGNQLSNPHQVGIYSAIQANVNANAPGGGPTGGFVAGFESAIGVNANGTTLPRAVSYSIGSVGVRGTGSSVERTIGVMSNDDTIGTIGNAFIADFADSVTFTGNWYIHYSGSRASYLGGALTVVGLFSTGSDIQFLNNGNGLLASDTTRFISYTTANGTQLDAKTKALIVANPSTRTTIGANGAATALTANPLGYLDITIGAVTAQIPYYNRGP